MNGPVVVGVDGSASSLAAVEAAALEAERRGTGLRLAHTLTWPSSAVAPGVPPWDPDGTGLRERVNGRLAEAERRAREAAPQVTITHDVLLGDLGDALENASRTASLTVVDGRPTPGLAARLTARGRGPLLVVRGRPAAHGPVVLADDTSPAAAEFAFAEASDRRVDLVVLHARTGVVRRTPPRLRKKYPGVTVHDRRLEGRTGRALVEASAGAQLVVIANRHRTVELLPGSSGRTLVSHARCPVAVVPAGRA